MNTQAQPSNPEFGRALKCLIGIWALAVGVGFYTLVDHANTPGAVGSPGSNWPAESRIVRDRIRANLILAVHPHCPCSRATMDALARYMSRHQFRTVATILFFKPVDAPEAWEITDLWYAAARIPGVTSICDENGDEAKKFGAETSGHVALFAPDGSLRFTGGITSSRGHEGDNPGLDALISCADHGSPRSLSWPVFGCPLRNPEAIQR